METGHVFELYGSPVTVVSSGCWVWGGRRTKKRLTPVWRPKGEKRSREVRKMVWGDLYGVEVPFRLRRTCGTPLCVSGYHQSIAHPRRLAKSFSSYDPKKYRVLWHRLQYYGWRNPEKVCIDQWIPRFLGMEPEFVKAMAYLEDFHPLIVLSGFAELVNYRWIKWTRFLRGGPAPGHHGVKHEKSISRYLSQMGAEAPPILLSYAHNGNSHSGKPLLAEGEIPQPVTGTGYVPGLL